MKQRTPLLRRILGRTVWTQDGCWLWQGSCTANGYGRIGSGRTSTSRSRTVLVHRAAYELLVGRVPAGLDLDHLCRVRHCCNPLHLEPVDRATNLRRGDGPRITAERSRRSHCTRGHLLDRNPSTDRAKQCRPCHRDAQRRYLARRS